MFDCRGITACPERDFFIDNLLVRVHFIIVMIRWTGLAPWQFEFPFPGILTSGLVVLHRNVKRFRGGLEFKAHRPVYHSTLGSRVIKKKKKGWWNLPGEANACDEATYM